MMKNYGICIRIARLLYFKKSKSTKNVAMKILTFWEFYVEK